MCTPSAATLAHPGMAPFIAAHERRRVELLAAVAAGPVDVRTASVAAPVAVARNPHGGGLLRSATAEEITAYYADNAPAPFDRPVRVGAVLVDIYTGPGSNTYGMPLGD